MLVPFLMGPLNVGDWLKWLWYHRNYIIIVVTPLALLPLPLISPTSVSVCVSVSVCAWR